MKGARYNTSTRSPWLSPFLQMVRVSGPLTAYPVREFRQGGGELLLHHN